MPVTDTKNKIIYKNILTQKINIFIIIITIEKNKLRGQTMKTCKVITASGLVVWCELSSRTIEELRTENQVKVITGGKK